MCAQPCSVARAGSRAYTGVTQARTQAQARRKPVIATAILQYLRRTEAKSLFKWSRDGSVSHLFLLMIPQKI